MSKINQFIADFEKVKELPTKVYVYPPIYKQEENTLIISNHKNTSQVYLFTYLFLVVVIMSIWKFKQELGIPVVVVVLWLLFFLLIFYFSYKKSIVSLKFDMTQKTVNDRKKTYLLADLKGVKNITLNKKTQLSATVLEFNNESKYVVVFKGSQEQSLLYVQILKKLFM